MKRHPLLADPQLAHFTHRVLQDAMVEATSDYWERRAKQLEAARPRPGDFTGQATPQDLVAAHDRLTEAAQACRTKATLLEEHRTVFDQTLTDLVNGTAA